MNKFLKELESKIIPQQEAEQLVIDLGLKIVDLLGLSRTDIDKMMFRGLEITIGEYVFAGEITSALVGTTGTGWAYYISVKKNGVALDSNSEAEVMAVLENYLKADERRKV